MLCRIAHEFELAMTLFMLSVNAGPASARVGFVHQIVVDQCAGLKPFKGRGRLKQSRVVRLAPGNEPTGMTEQGSKQLAAVCELERGIGQLGGIGIELG